MPNLDFDIAKFVILFVWEMTFELVSALIPLVLFALLLVVMQKVSYKNIYDVFGRRGIVYSGFFGTSLHELSHYLMCLVFDHKVTKIRFFEPSDDGTLGYVEHSYNPFSYFQRSGNFFIGLAPFYFGVLCVYISTIVFLDVNVFRLAKEGDVLDSFVAALLRLLSALQNGGWGSFLWVLTCVSVVLHMMPSRADLRGAALGGGVLLSTYYLIVTIAYFWFGAIEALMDKIYRSSLELSLLLFNITTISFVVCIATFLLKLCSRIFVRR